MAVTKILELQRGARVASLQNGPDDPHLMVFIFACDPLPLSVRWT